MEIAPLRAVGQALVIAAGEKRRAAKVGRALEASGASSDAQQWENPSRVIQIRKDVACSPKVDPGAMRVGGAPAPPNSHHETQTTDP